MILREFVKKLLKLEEPNEEHDLRAKNRILDKEVTGVKGQMEVDEAEINNLKKKLWEIRRILGKDDKTFSDYTRKQIDKMSIKEFTKVESEIDQDVIDGKIFLM